MKKALFNTLPLVALASILISFQNCSSNNRSSSAQSTTTAVGAKVERTSSSTSIEN